MTETMKGTEKQVAFAEIMRTQAIDAINESMKINAEYFTKHPETKECYISVLNMVKDYSGHASHMIYCVKSKWYDRAISMLKDGRKCKQLGWARIANNKEEY